MKLTVYTGIAWSHVSVACLSSSNINYFHAALGSTHHPACAGSGIMMTVTKAMGKLRQIYSRGYKVHNKLNENKLLYEHM